LAWPIYHPCASFFFLKIVPVVRTFVCFVLIE
jgi:hypothetical protein